MGGTSRRTPASQGSVTGRNGHVMAAGTRPLLSGGLSSQPTIGAHPARLGAGEGPEAMSEFQRRSTRQLVCDLVQVHAAINLSRVRKPSAGPMSDEERTEWHDLCALAAMEWRLVRELQRRRDKEESLRAWSARPAAASLRRVRQAAI